MYKTKKPHTLFCLLSICLFLISSCKPFKEAECTGITGFKVNKIDISGIDADIQLGVKNPNTIGFSVYPSTFDVIYNGVNLGTAHSSKRVHIAANTEKAYTFNLKSSFKNASMIDVMKLINGGGKGMLQITGNMRAGKFYLKKKFPVNVKERVSL